MNVICTIVSYMGVVQTGSILTQSKTYKHKQNLIISMNVVVFVYSLHCRYYYYIYLIRLSCVYINNNYVFSHKVILAPSCLYYTYFNWKFTQCIVDQILPKIYIIFFVYYREFVPPTYTTYFIKS